MSRNYGWPKSFTSDGNKSLNVFDYEQTNGMKQIDYKEHGNSMFKSLADDEKKFGVSSAPITVSMPDKTYEQKMLEELVCACIALNPEMFGNSLDINMEQFNTVLNGHQGEVLKMPVSLQLGFQNQQSPTAKDTTDYSKQSSEDSGNDENYSENFEENYNSNYENVNNESVEQNNEQDIEKEAEKKENIPHKSSDENADGSKKDGIDERKESERIADEMAQNVEKKPKEVEKPKETQKQNDVAQEAKVETKPMSETATQNPPQNSDDYYVKTSDDIKQERQENLAKSYAEKEAIVKERFNKKVDKSFAWGGEGKESPRKFDTNKGYPGRAQVVHINKNGMKYDKLIVTYMNKQGSLDTFSTSVDTEEDIQEKINYAMKR